MVNLYSPPRAGGEAAASLVGKTSRPLKRAAPRFLGDDDDDSDTGGQRGRVDEAVMDMGRRVMSAQDVDKLFAHLDKDDNEDGMNLEDGQYKLPPPLKATQTALINDTITAFGTKSKSNKNRRLGNGNGIEDADGDGDGETGKKEGEEIVRKKARPRALMNEQRLLGDRGLRKLKDNLKGFKIKGKGFEVRSSEYYMT